MSVQRRLFAKLLLFAKAVFTVIARHGLEGQRSRCGMARQRL